MNTPKDDPHLEELARKLRGLTDAKNAAQTVANKACSEERQVAQALREYIKRTYGVDAWRL